MRLKNKQQQNTKTVQFSFEDWNPILLLGSLNNLLKVPREVLMCVVGICFLPTPNYGC